MLAGCPGQVLQVLQTEDSNLFSKRKGEGEPQANACAYFLSGALGLYQVPLWIILSRLHFTRQLAQGHTDNRQWGPEVTYLSSSSSLYDL